jgi:hypothetical protein
VSYKWKKSTKDALVMGLLIITGLGTLYMCDRYIDDEDRAASRISENLKEWKLFFDRSTKDGD